MLCYTSPVLTLKLSDFGASAVLCRQGDQFSTPLSVFRTTFRYAAPEILRKQPYGFPADVWSAGIILYEILQSDPRQPAVMCTSKNAEDHIAPQQALMSQVVQYGAQCKPGEALHLACRMLHPEQDRRLVTQSLHEDQWLASGQESVSGLAGHRKPHSEARLPEDAPEIWQLLSSSAHILELLCPSDIIGFRPGIRKLGIHSGNMLLHYILSSAKYPFAIEILAVEFSLMPDNFEAMDLTKACHKAIKKCAAVSRSEKAGHDKEDLGRLIELHSDTS